MQDWDTLYYYIDIQYKARGGHYGKILSNYDKKPEHLSLVVDT